ncbi:tRNA (adenosine(37)-N6)-threonylcarbamoyltransferase complex dimerization subunit type 1 TsaB [Mariniluteicoccus endophyticus]
MSLVIGIDTSADVRVGVARDGQVVARREVADTRQHVEALASLIHDAVAEAGSPDDLSLVCVGLGPGPFTGLRVGIVAAQVLASVRHVPLHGVCSLDVMARAHADGSGEFVVASDARRKELYWSRHDAAGVRLGDPQISPPTDLPDLPVVGPGVAAYADVLGDRATAGPGFVDAGLMAALATDLPSVGTEPLYLRRPDAEVSTKRKSTLVTPPVRVRRPRA